MLLATRESRFLLMSPSFLFLLILDMLHSCVAYDNSVIGVAIVTGEKFSEYPLGLLSLCLIFCLICCLVALAHYLIRLVYNFFGKKIKMKLLPSPPVTFIWPTNFSQQEIYLFTPDKYKCNLYYCTFI